MDERETLLSRIMTCDFILNETGLFLDTHPDNEEALAFFKKHQDMRKTAADEYSEKFGMLSYGGYSGQQHWQWVDGPWPWEYGEG